MLFRHIVLLVDVALQSRKDLALVQEMSPAKGLDRDLGLVCQNRSCGEHILLGREARTGWGDGKVVELLSQDNDGLLVQKRVLLRHLLLLLV